MIGWLDAVNQQILAVYNTRILGGFAEPFYRAAVGNAPAEIRFTRDYQRSALHELAHWCVAGHARRRQDDYGYWYVPDGRDAAQQQRFFQVEIRPQAIEKHFCQALKLPFEVSADNLDHVDISGLSQFRRAVDRQYLTYATRGLPQRAAAIARLLTDWCNNN
jgi:hypothetical protein